MALIKNAKVIAQNKEKTVSVNYNSDLVERFKKWDGKSLVGVDAKEELTSITIGRKTVDSGEIVNLIIGMKGLKIAFPLSRGFADSVDEDPIALLNGEFYARNKFDADKDEEGVYPYSGPLYISFGKAAGLSFDSEKSLINAEAVETEE